MTLEIKPGWTRYQSTKIVRAAPITYVNEPREDGSRLISTARSADVHPAEFFARGLPEVGDMLVQYSDGYISWSPRKAFEEGYENLLDEPIPHDATVIPLGPHFHAQAGLTHGHLHDVYTTRDVGENRRIHVGQLSKAAVLAWAEAVGSLKVRTLVDTSAGKRS
jgi:hypothetical protein